MSALTVNGISIPVSYDSFTEEEPRIIGESTEAVNGQMRDSVRARKRTWSGETAFQIKATTDAIRALLEADGEFWPLSTLYSVGGVGPSAVVGTPTVAGTLVTGVGSSVAFPRPLPRGTLAFLHLDTTMKSRVYTWDEDIGSGFRQWVEGARNDGAAFPTGFACDFDGDDPIFGGAVATFDNVIMLPFVVPDAWPALIHAGGLQWGALPTGLIVAGDLIGANAVRCTAQIGRQRFKKSVGGIHTSLSFRLLEV